LGEVQYQGAGFNQRLWGHGSGNHVAAAAAATAAVAAAAEAAVAAAAAMSKAMQQAQEGAGSRRLVFCLLKGVQGSRTSNESSKSGEASSQGTAGCLE
jgi:hypothetical protein